MREYFLNRRKFGMLHFKWIKFDNVDINGQNLNEAQLLNCKWKNIKIHDLKNQMVIQVKLLHSIYLISIWDVEIRWMD
ncbi:unnamed protein product (macronuclear) [Paramecium tetraurelia]|uniref:Pentapeptide repeat-containing protein n=1 Tax=Paramecium tetraurelia TaxID=5888 RepID=A0D5G3_PARTE|nr:uncharacterized protein GSPATT00013729001 [Paramecium tetraurelia]CAK78280.1 unnamed protein product [Paramecium tetraurelia]|eukprot:XP_001445677.1 hypothetical protein (macronuclear) [Paramecium tetraurelia strain d4-2]